MNGMDSEDEASKPSARNVKLLQQPPSKQRVCNLEKNIDGMIAGRVLTKKMILDPEYRVGKRQIICGSAARPNFQQARITSQQWVPGYQEGILEPPQARSCGLITLPLY